MREDGVYKFHGLRVNSFNGKHLTTAVNSIIVKSDKKMNLLARKEY